MLNHWTGMGRLTADPELRTTNSGISVASFTLAIDRDYKDEDGNRQADFVPITAWRTWASFSSKYLRKGRMICVTGRWQQQRWRDKDGNNRTSWTVVADGFYFADSKKADAGDAAPAEAQFTDVSDEDDEKLPF